MAMSCAAVFFAFFCSLAAAGEPIRRLPEMHFSDSEIRVFVDDLRRLDERRARPSQIRLDYQGHTSSRNDDDNARSMLFTRVDETALFTRGSTYSKLIALYDNYVFDTGMTEQDTPQERAEIDEFINSIAQTRLFRYFRDFLREKDHPMAISEASMREWLRQLWFGQYSRAKGIKDTCAFEHVFLGEAKNGELSGMHNWVRFYTLEHNMTATSRLDYKGFLVKRYNIFAAIKYSVGKVIKRSGGLIIGSTPEFDVALFTFCFLARRGHTSTCDFEIDGCSMSVTSFDITQEGKVFIGSAYPSAGRITGTCRRLAGGGRD